MENLPINSTSSEETLSTLMSLPSTVNTTLINAFNASNSTPRIVTSEQGPQSASSVWSDLESRYHGWLVSGIFAWTAIFLSFYLIVKHLQHFTKPQHQRHIVRILFMVPVYSLTAWLNYKFVGFALYSEFLRSIYEAVVIYEFFALLMQYLGSSEMERKRTLEGKDIQFMLFPFCCVSFDPNSRWFLMDCKIGVLQYVVVRPLTTIFALMMQSAGRFHSENMSISDGYFWYVTINFISTSLAMYTLALFYLTIEREIKDYKPLNKIISVKFVVFCMYWQGLLIGFLHSQSVIQDRDETIAITLQSFLVCLEMFIVSLWHMRVSCFGWQEFKGADCTFRKTAIWPSLLDTVNPKDTLLDVATGSKHLMRRIFLWLNRNHQPIYNEAEECGPLELRLNRRVSEEVRNEEIWSLT